MLTEWLVASNEDSQMGIIDEMHNKKKNKDIIKKMLRLLNNHTKLYWSFEIGHGQNFHNY